ncbi:DUF4124 domain-containing protein [Comamonas sp.]|jgi:hypothetical protein|uniref:DUF4124 domain-containing protein n=1 Tax=Comamonas sp. TaxID=34028 RepID=UPI003D0D3C77
MPYARHTLAAGLLAAASLLSAPAWAINKCVDAQGRTSFQDEPCAAGQKAEAITVTPSSQGINPREHDRPVTSRLTDNPPPSVPAAAPADAPEPRPADCPDPERMKSMQIEAESIALPLPIRKQKRASFEALKERCGG